VYSVPETSQVESTPAPSAPVAVVPVAPQGSVQTMTTEATCALGMTAGERTSLIPNRVSTYVPWGHFSDVEKILKNRSFFPLFITGLSGNGKTMMVDQACAKLKRDLYRVNITTQTDEDDLLGGFRLVDGNTVWQDGPVTAAMKNGGILLLDEIDLASNKIMCLQPVLEGKGVFLKKINTFVAPAPGFTVIATANTKGKGSDDGRFVGTSVLNEAFLDRFSITMEQEYPSRATEKKILKKEMQQVGVDAPDFADNLVKWAEIIRKSFYEGAVEEIVSTRRLVDIVKAFAIFNDKMKSIDLTIARFDDDTREGFRSLYSKVDSDAGAQVAEEEAEENAADLESATRVNLGVTFHQKDEAKNAGAKWDKVAKTWYVTGDQYRADRAKWDAFGDVTAVNDDAECPF
jgi:MoxR-like ATPase